MSGKTILILGGGVGGTVTANSLREKLAPEHRIIVVDKRAEYIYTPSLLWVMVGWRRPSQISKGLHCFVRSGVELVQAEAQEIDVNRQRVKTSAGDLGYDYLVVALGADLAPQAMPGFNQAAITPFDLKGASELWSALQQFEGGRVAVIVSSMPYKCPAAPYETAMLLEDYLRRRGIRGKCKVDIYTPEGLPMGVAGTAMGETVVGMMADKGIRFHPQLSLTHIDAEQKELVFSNREPATFDLLAGVPPHRPPAVVSGTSLVSEAGWIPVNRVTLQTQVENVYAIGDVAAVTLANGKPLPKAGVFAEGQGKTVAQTIANQIRGASGQSQYDGLGYCWIETGGGSAGFASGEFYAEPDPVVPLPQSGRIWHLGKILFEKYWMGKGLTRNLSRLGLKFGAKLFGVEVSF